MYGLVIAVELCACFSFPYAHFVYHNFISMDRLFDGKIIIKKKIKTEQIFKAFCAFNTNSR